MTWQAIVLSSVLWIVPGQTSVRVTWEPASGPVAGYVVVGDSDMELARVEAGWLGWAPTLALIPCGPGQQTVRVAAFRDDGAVGALSPPSDPFRCLGVAGWNPDAAGDGRITLLDFGAFLKSFGGQLLE